MAATRQTLLRQLFTTRPPDFVAARNALVKELKRTKETDTAATVARFRRPGWADWALNVTAERQPELVEAFADAANQMREAQAAAIEGREGPDVRVALNELRERTAELTKRAAGTLEEDGRPPETPTLTARLAEIAANAAAVSELVAGVLGSGEPGTVDLFAGLEPAAGPRPQRAPRPKPAPAATKPAAEPDAAERRRHERELQRAEREHESSMRALARSDAELTSATAAVTKAEEELARATVQRERAEVKRAEAAASVDRTKAALDELR